MANTGINQAVIAYKVRSTDGAPLDIDGKPTSETGKKQAVALLAGTANPNPALYEVQFYFNANSEVLGEPTAAVSPTKCPTGVIYVSVDSLIFDPANTAQSFTLTSSDAWALTSTDAALAGVFVFSMASGREGVFKIDVSVAAGAAVGQGYVTFTNTVSGATARLFMVNVLTKPWILENGTWNMLGFWTAAGIWKTV